MIRRILLGLNDADHVRSEIEYAVSLGDRYGAEITGVTLVARPGEAFLEAAVAAFEQAARAAGLRHQVKREARRDAFDLLISEGRYHDLTILGLRSLLERRGGGEGAGETGEEGTGEPGETLARLVAAGVRPILAVAPEYRAIRRVLVAYSGSMESAKTLRQYLQLHPFRDAEMRIVVFGHEPARATRLLEGARQYCRAHGFAPQLVHLSGAPHDQILPYARDWDADLIVLGNSAKNLMMRRVLGETALHVMRHSRCPLFLSQ
ncbi:MAG: universal stress protein [Pirellulales bacterium]